MVSSALTTAKDLTQDELNKLLQGAGYASAPGERQHRLNLKGQVFTASDTNEMYVYNPKQPTVPAFTVRIVKPLEEYWAIWIDDNIARQFGRADLANTFSKNYITPNPDRRLWPSDEAYDELKTHIGEYNDQYGNPMKAAWKADLLVQIVPEDGNLVGDETQYALTLSTTGVIEFRGTSKEVEKGAVSDLNFMQKLLRFGMEKAPEGTEKNRAVLDALSSYAMGGVVAEVRVAQMSNKEKNQTWTVPVFDPIHIEPMQQGDLLVGSGNPDEVGL